MPDDLFKKIIGECSQYQELERLILYMNNEPLTDPCLVERINYSKEKLPWASVHILTNGTLLNERLAENLIKSKLDWIGISFHGISKETIESAMGIPYELSLKRIVEFIEKAKTKRNINDFVMITFLRHKYLSEEEKEQAIRFWREKGIARISYFEGPVSRAGNVTQLPKTYHHEQITGCNSIWADEMLHIVEDGTAVLCCMDWKREVTLGNLKEQNIRDIWNGRRKEVWEMIAGKCPMPEDFLCRKCEEARLG
jgi:MoaA/NifB/PqqE/SkfB family radical SAM enzyme